MSLLAAVAAGSIGCGSTSAASKSYAVTFEASNDDGEPMKDVKFTSGTSYIGATDHRCLVMATLRGSEGQNVPLIVGCPDGYIAPEEPAKLRLAEVRRVGAPGASGVRFETVCTRKARDIVVVVRTAGAPQLPVEIGGKFVGETDANGNADFRLTQDREARALSVSLGTTNFPNMRPQNPSRVFELDGSDAILLIDQTFATEKKARPRQSFTATSAVVRKRVPPRVDSARFHAL